MKPQPFLYDTFLCHNSLDKSLVQNIEAQLRARGVRCWFDKYELQPGKNWQQFIDAEWPRIASVILCFGKNGISAGQQYELDHLVPDAKPSQSIIPIILPDAPVADDAESLIPEELRNNIWVDFRNSGLNPIDALIWGIQGENPYIRLSIGSYYKETDGLEEQELKQYLGKLISKDSKILSYPKQVREVIIEVFEDHENSENILLFHNGVSVPKDKYGPRHMRGGGWNLDHIWPKAFGFLDRRNIISELHNICPADFVYNAERGAGFFYDRRLDFREKEKEMAPTRYFDPRGVIARACLYMEIRYQGLNSDPVLELDEKEHKRGEGHLGSLETLLYWNKLTRVSTAERKRNDKIAEVQGNRNPFVDRPEFADLIWYPV